MGKSVRIGLDIGSSAVRAAEVVVDGEGKVLRRFAQVGLPAGAVVEGEVHDQAAVAAAVKRLWQHGHFSRRSVVVGLGSQRAMVRQVAMPSMSDAELRSALRFKIGEFLPIPVDQAVVDFAPLPGGGGVAGERMLLLVAAQRDVVADVVSAVETAGLRVQAVDSSSLALLRAVATQARPPGTGEGGGGLEAVVGIGAELVTVAVREGGVPRFVRTVTLTGPAGPAGAGDIVAGGVSERSRGGFGRPGNAGVAVSAAPRIEAIVNEVRSSLEYILSQSGTGGFERVLVTGGGAMLPGVTEALSAAVRLPVSLAETPLQVDRRGLALEKATVDEASYRWLTAVGLALWGTDSYGQPSLLLPEVLARRRQREVTIGAVATLAVVVAGCAALSVVQLGSVSSVNDQIRSSGIAAAGLHREIGALGYVLQVPSEVQSRRQLAVEALNGDVDWVGFVRRLQAAMPANVVPEQITLTKTLVPAAGASGGGASMAPGAIVGKLVMTAETTGGAGAVAGFIDRVSLVKGLSALWVASATKSSGKTEIDATAQLTTGVLSTRANALPGGSR
jgi:type IV pilus assembly protein PilM